MAAHRPYEMSFSPSSLLTRAPSCRPLRRAPPPHQGNKAATFPLQLLGWDVDVVNTVQFSNHTGAPL